MASSSTFLNVEMIIENKNFDDLVKRHIFCRQRQDDKWEHDLFEDGEPRVSSMD